MQFDDEGVEGVEGVDDSAKTQVDLERHLKSHGLSVVGYNKLSKDVLSGDMSVDILIEFDENELINLANEYGLTTLQKKAFIKAVMLLPNYCKQTTEKKENEKEKEKEKEKEFVHVTPQEQKMLDEINELLQLLENYSIQCLKNAKYNKNILLKNMTNLKKCGNLLKQSIDKTIDDIVHKVK